MALLAVQPVDRDGLPIVFTAAAAGGDTAPSHNQNVLIVRNDSAGAVTVTLVTTQTVAGLAVADLAVAVPAGGEAAFRTGPVDLYGDVNGNVAITYSAVTTVTVAVIQI